MKKLLIFVFLIGGFLANEANAQVYNNAIGLRLGYPLSISYKQFITNSHAFEVYAGRRGWASYSWTNVSAAYLVHNSIPNVDGLQWYYGGGASVYFWNFKSSFGGGDFNNTTIGIQGYIGLDYTFSDIPLSLTVDWIPTYFFSGFNDGFGSGYGTLGARYILSR